MAKRNIAVTGYYATGSSAVIDLLREYDEVKIVPEIGRLYEHVVFYTSGGLFDLCTLLTHANTPQGSDMILNHFVQAMKRLNDNDMVWFGSYKNLYGDKFQNIVDEFVNSIAKSRIAHTAEHVKYSRFSLIKATAQLAAHILQGRKIAKYGRHYVYDKWPVYFAMPSEEELYNAAKKFTSSYFSMISKGHDGYSIYDHLVWPQQVDVHAKCFDDNFKVIILDRDPRDLYLLNKYYFCKIHNTKPHLPDTPEAFIAEWKKTVVPQFSNPNALAVHFEDLIYKYDETVARIEAFLGLDPSEHINIKGKFQPEKSIENTQVFRVKKEWEQEVELITKELPDMLYNFPYERKPNWDLMFDSPNS